jgi:hypothetical protein
MIIILGGFGLDLSPAENPAADPSMKPESLPLEKTKYINNKMINGTNMIDASLSNLLHS